MCSRKDFEIMKNKLRNSSRKRYAHEMTSCSRKVFEIVKNKSKNSSRTHYAREKSLK